MRGRTLAPFSERPGRGLAMFLAAAGLVLFAAALFPVIMVFSLDVSRNALAVVTPAHTLLVPPAGIDAQLAPTMRVGTPLTQAPFTLNPASPKADSTPTLAGLGIIPMRGFAMEEPPPSEIEPEPQLQPQPEVPQRPTPSQPGGPASTARPPAEAGLPPHSPRSPARPGAVRGIYLTGWVAGSPSRLRPLLDLIEQTELNTVVIEIKDEMGRLSFRSSVPLAGQVGASQAKIRDIKSLLAELKRRGIYTIARQVVFKDLALASVRSSWATQAAPGRVWRDSQSLAWTDPYNRQVWDYNIAIAKEAAGLGFDEIQFDYVRFPDTPQAHALFYPAKSNAGRTWPNRASAIRAFLADAHASLHPLGVAVSADVFGLVTSAQDDLGIGQRLEDVAPVVDYVSPMVYPSHYALGSYGLKNPDVAPYETVHTSLSIATRRLKAIGLSNERLVPWLQDFSLRAHYGAAEVRAQIKAANDLGIREWLLWNPANVYTRAALKSQ